MFPAKDCFAASIAPSSRAERRVMFFSCALWLLCTLLDQMTKWAVTRTMTFKGRINVIPGLFDLTYITNDGAAWNMLAGRFWLLLMISLIAAAMILIFFRKITDGWPERYPALALILSGIAGNSIDRVFRGGRVVDFLDFYIGAHHWPAFNVADSCICVGVFMFIVSNLLRPERKPTKQ